MLFCPVPHNKETIEFSKLGVARGADIARVLQNWLQGSFCLDRGGLS